MFARVAAAAPDTAQEGGGAGVDATLAIWLSVSLLLALVAAALIAKFTVRQVRYFLEP